MEARAAHGGIRCQHIREGFDLSVADAQSPRLRLEFLNDRPALFGGTYSASLDPLIWVLELWSRVPLRRVLRARQEGKHILWDSFSVTGS